jgi:ABC-type transport system substrate-binding protein
VAFERYALGRPKMDRIRLTWNDDPNAIVARLLAGDVDIALDGSIQFQHGTTLRQQWSTVGVLDFQPGNIRKLDAQNRPEYARPRAILDPRARRAVLHAIDRRELTDALIGPDGIVAETVAPPSVPFYPDLLRVVATHPHDVRRTEQILGELGYAKGPDGFFTSPAEGRFTLGVQGVAQGQEGQETTIVTDMMRKAGIDAQLNLISDVTVQANDEVKSTYPALRTNYYPVVGSLGQDRNLASRISAPDNRWSASNKEGWANEEHDQWFEVWNRGLDPGERNHAMIQMLRVVNDELPTLPLYFDLTVIAHVAALTGPGGPRGPETTRYWNLHEWRWK